MKINSDWVGNELMAYYSIKFTTTKYIPKKMYFIDCVKEIYCFWKNLLNYRKL